MKRYFYTQFDIGDPVWTCEYGSCGYDVRKRYVEYFKLTESGVVYGFTYGVEVPKAQCFHTEGMATLCADEWNRKIREEKENYA